MLEDDELLEFESKAAAEHFITALPEFDYDRILTPREFHGAE